MQIRPLSIAGAFEVTPVQHGDGRGVFLEWFKSSTFQSVVDRDFDLAQANCSVSSAGVVRGIHFSDVPPGQAKYVTCIRGAVLDVIVDIRVGSPTYGQWDTVTLDDVDRRAVFIDVGLGHGFMALTDDATLVYMCSSEYAPEREHTVHPLDPAIAIAWPTTGRHGNPLEPQLSDRDAVAPSLAEAAARGVLPVFDSAR